MKAVLQRVQNARVEIEKQVTGEIGQGLMILLGVAEGDTAEQCDYLANKIVNLRIFEDEEGKMNRSVLECKGEALVVSNFTLCGNCKKGNRPSFMGAARPETAIPLYERFLAQLEGLGLPKVAHGTFGADMQVMIQNDGPVTILLDTDEIMPSKQ